ncbi:MAG: LLM class flavin-dependent oxidoreductase [Ilumatobacteraceae bacterium]
MIPPLSLLDLAIIGKGATAADALAASVVLAQRAEQLGIRRIWYAEHHNMGSIASSAPAVLIAHVAAHTRTITLGAGGVMLPNHSPLTIAEQYGTLATLHPGRIELGLGRAPGSDQVTMRAMRRDHTSADTFADDVREVQGYLSGDSRVPGVSAVPGAGTDVPLYILGSSLYGASLAAHLGLPYAFASHFAPDALRDAVALYRRRFEPSAVLDAPHVLAAVNVICDDTDEGAADQFRTAARWRVQRFLNLPEALHDAELDRVIASPQGQQIVRMMTYSAVGDPGTVSDYLEQFALHADADELVVALSSPTIEGRLHSLDLVTAAATPGLAAPLAPTAVPVA